MGEQHVTLAARADAQGLGEVAREDTSIAIEGGGIGVVKQHAKGGWDVAAPGSYATLGLHHSFKCALDLDDLNARLEQPGGRPLEEALEEPLDCGKGACHRVGESSRGHRSARHRTIGAGVRY